MFFKVYVSVSDSMDSATKAEIISMLSAPISPTYYLQIFIVYYFCFVMLYKI